MLGPTLHHLIETLALLAGLIHLPRLHCALILGLPLALVGLGLLVMITRRPARTPVPRRD